MAEILSSAFGGSKDKGEPVKINDLSPEAAIASMNAVFEAASAG